jgi:hypothetical protein
MSLSDILKKCLSYQGDIRNQGELELDLRAQTNFPMLLEECSSELANEQAPKENRQLCATIIKNMIHPSGRHQGKWEQMNHDTKLNIKTTILASLASEVKEVRKAAALTVAGKFEFNIRNMFN